MTYIPVNENRGVPLHESHVIIEIDDTPDPHNPAWMCTVCREISCALCELEEGDPLALPCTGREWWLTLRYVPAPLSCLRSDSAADD
jgi:hypothetical protein